MNSRRTILAIVLSMAIFIGWQHFSVYMGWLPDPAEQAELQRQQAEKDAAEQARAGQSPQTAPVLQDGFASPEPSQPAFTPTPGRDVVVETPLYRAVLNSSGGVLREFSLKRYKATIEADSPPVQMISPSAAAKAPMGLILDGAPTWGGTDWELEGQDLNLAEGQTGSLTLRGEVNGMRVTRVLTFDAGKYSIHESLSLQSAQPRGARVTFSLSAGRLGGENPQDITRVAYSNDGSFKEESGEKTLKAGMFPRGVFPWVGVMSNYFLSAVIPASPDGIMRVKLEDEAYRVGLERDGLMVSPEAPATLQATYYLGPKDQKILDGEPGGLGIAINYGWFSVIARPLLAMLNFFYGLVHNYGVAIILLTLVIKIVLWPLSYKSYKSMEQMKKLQPMLTKLKEKYGDDKEAMNREMMQLYKTYKVNPASGCLPIVVQIPVFIGLYQGLLGAIQLRHASFIPYFPGTDAVWLADLSVKDPFYITPIVMGATMLLQQMLTPSTGDPTQRKIMMIMPVVFTFMFLNFSSGLVIYWLANNVISIAQQWWQLRRA